MPRFNARPSRIAALAAALLVSMTWVAACGDDTSVNLNPDGDGDGNGDGNVEGAVMTAVVHDSSAVLPEGRTTPSPVDSTSYDGTVTGTAQVEVFSDADGWISLGEATDVAFEIYCEEAAIVHGDVSLDPGTYSGVRLTLTDFQASVNAGAVVHAQTVADAFVVALGDGTPLVIERTVTPFVLENGQTTTLLFDLNTEVWLDQDVVDSGVAPGADVQSSTNVIIR